MFNAIPYINDALTLTENCFNMAGYFPALQPISTRWRSHFGLGQIISGLALAALGFLAHRLAPALMNPSYLSLPLQCVALGLLYANHGVFNVIRSYVERGNFPGLTLVYDFYGKKVLPALSPRSDLLRLFFSCIKAQLDKIRFMTVFPPEFVRV